MLYSTSAVSKVSLNFFSLLCCSSSKALLLRVRLSQIVLISLPAVAAIFLFKHLSIHYLSLVLQMLLSVSIAVYSILYRAILDNNPNLKMVFQHISSFYSFFSISQHEKWIWKFSDVKSIVNHPVYILSLLFSCIYSIILHRRAYLCMLWIFQKHSKKQNAKQNKKNFSILT